MWMHTFTSLRLPLFAFYDFLQLSDQPNCVCLSIRSHNYIIHMATCNIENTIRQLLALYMSLS